MVSLLEKEQGFRPVLFVCGELVFPEGIPSVAEAARYAELSGRAKALPFRKLYVDTASAAHAEAFCQPFGQAFEQDASLR